MGEIREIEEASEKVEEVSTIITELLRGVEERNNILKKQNIIINE